MQSSYRQHTDRYNSVFELVNTAVVTKFYNEEQQNFM